MNHQHLFHINRFLFLILLLLFLTTCNSSKNSFIDELKCKSTKDLGALVDNFSSYMIENDGFFSVLEKKGDLHTEPYNSEYSYKERNVKLSYLNEKNIFLVNERIEDIGNLDYIVMEKLEELFNYQGKSLNEINPDLYKYQNSGLVFEIMNSYRQKENKFTKNQSYSMLLLLKKLDCSINSVRENVAKIVFRKEYEKLSQKEKTIVNNIVPKIYYVINLNDNKASVPSYR